MKILRLFDSLKLVRAMFVAVVAATFILNVANAATTAIQSVIAYGKTEQSATPTPTNPVPIMTNNGELKVNPNLSDGLVIGGISMEGALVSTAQRLRTNYIDIEGQRRYTYSTNLDGLVDGVRAIIAFYDSNKVTLQRTANNPVDGTVLSPATARYMAVAYYNSAETVSEYQSRVKFRLFQGTSANEVYVDGLTETIRDSAGHTATAQMLLGINDTYRDEQNINTGAITRRVGIKVLDGSESWYSATYSNGRIRFYTQFSEIFTINDGYSKISPMVSTHFIPSSGEKRADGSVFFYHDNMQKQVNFIPNGPSTVAQFKAWLAEQYANGTPVIVVYPLATETTENVTTQTLTTAPVRQTAGSILGMPIEVVLGDGTREWVRDMITIATTRYSEEQFAPVETRLDAAVAAVDTVVSQTMSQAQAIDQIANNKQTRPDEGCPAKYCLLVEDEDGTPHWYPIAGANGVAHNLPDGYTELQYIESTGTQYIDTGLHLDYTKNFRITGTVMNPESNKRKIIIGNYTSNNSQSFSIEFATGAQSLTSNGIRVYFGHSDVSLYNKSTVALPLNTDIDIDFVYTANTKSFILTCVAGGQTYSLSGSVPGILEQTSDESLSMFLDKRANPSAIANSLAIKTITVTQDTNNFNFVSSKDSSNTVGMYDMVSGTFFTNAGTGTFTAGPDM